VWANIPEAVVANDKTWYARTIDKRWDSSWVPENGNTRYALGNAKDVPPNRVVFTSKELEEEGDRRTLAVPPSDSDGEGDESATDWPEINKSLILVGAKHLGPGREEAEKLREHLVDLAEAGQIMAGFESLGSDEHDRLEPFTNIFGIENDFAFHYSHVLMATAYFANDMTPLFESRKRELIENILRGDLNFESWQRLESKVAGQAAELYEEINEYVTAAILANKRGSEIVKEFDTDMGSVDHWVALFKSIALDMTEAVEQDDDEKFVPADRRPDLNRIRQFIADPTNDELSKYIAADINYKWRDQFIVENIREREGVAIDEGIGIYIFIGDGHIANIEALLREESLELDLKAYRVTDEGVPGIPAKYLPKENEVDSAPPRRLR